MGENRKGEAANAWMKNRDHRAWTENQYVRSGDKGRDGEKEGDALSRRNMLLGEKSGWNQRETRVQ